MHGSNTWQKKHYVQLRQRASLLYIASERTCATLPGGGSASAPPRPGRLCAETPDGEGGDGWCVAVTRAFVRGAAGSSPGTVHPDLTQCPAHAPTSIVLLLMKCAWGCLVGSRPFSTITDGTPVWSGSSHTQASRMACSVSLGPRCCVTRRIEQAPVPVPVPSGPPPR